MAKGSVRKKGKKWYYRFYIEDESGRQVQREFAGTESKSETEALLRKAMEDYEAKKFVAKSENATVGMLLDMWVEEELKPSNLSNGTVMAYTAAVKRIKQHPIGNRKLKTVTSDHLQAFIDFMSYGGTNPDGTTTQPLSKGYMLQFSAVLQGAFRFAVFPKRFITFNPMQYVKLRGRKDEADIFCEDEADTVSTPTITHEQYLKLTDYLKGKDNPALLPVQIAYYTGLRIGEVCGLTWQDINLDEQYLTVRRSMRYNGTRHKTEIGTTKRSKVRTVDFCDTLAAILRIAKMEQRKNRFKYGELYHLNYYKVVKEKDRSYYEVYNLPRTEQAPEGYKELSFVCVRPDGMFESSSAVGAICRKAKKEVEGLEDFHFHMLRHTYTSNLLSGGAKPTDVQELLGHSDVNTTMSIYAHATREAKRTSARLLDKVVGGE
ncbi:MAG: site-specific integrase [Clostridiales bacterium]|nr:site-specific integrase [Clostridiales bacterium]